MSTVVCVDEGGLWVQFSTGVNPSYINYPSVSYILAKSIWSSSTQCALFIAARLLLQLRFLVYRVQRTICGHSWTTTLLYCSGAVLTQYCGVVRKRRVPGPSGIERFPKGFKVPGWLVSFSSTLIVICWQCINWAIFGVNVMPTNWTIQDFFFFKLSSEAMTTYYFHSCTCVRTAVRHAPVSQKRLKIFEWNLV
jgi:hypothetical protein